MTSLPLLGTGGENVCVLLTAARAHSQGQYGTSVSDCACTCLSSSLCIGYVYLGDVSQCWLQNRLSFQVGFQQDLSPTTITARIGVPGALRTRGKGGRRA